MCAKIEVIDADVVVVGGGVSGLCSALSAALSGAEVYLVSKGKTGMSGSSYYSDILCEFTAYSCALSDGGIESHVSDLKMSGDGVNDHEILRVFAEEAPRTVKLLQELGVEFDRDENGYMKLYKTSGHSIARSITWRAGLSHAILDSLKSQKTFSDVRSIEDCMVIDVISDGKMVHGCLAFDLKSGEIKVFRTNSVILCAGGVGNVFEYTTNPPDITGDTIALAYRAGARLANLEFVQFMPACVSPIRGYIIPGDALRAGQFYDFSGKLVSPSTSLEAGPVHFMEAVVRLCMQLYAQGRSSPRGGVLWRALDKSLYEKIPRTISLFAERGVDVFRDHVEILPASHECVGGIVINADAESTVKGLYAPSESSAGIQGAIRLSGSTFPQALVFGTRAGKKAAYNSKQRRTFDDDLIDKLTDYWANRIDLLYELPSLTLVTKERLSLSRLLHRTWLTRTADSLFNALEYVKSHSSLLSRNEENRTNYSVNPIEIKRALEYENMITVAELLIRATDIRKESRGHHYRIDFPTKNEFYDGKIIIIQKEGDTVKLRLVPNNEAYKK